MYWNYLSSISGIQKSSFPPGFSSINLLHSLSFILSNMFTTRFFYLSAFAALLSLGTANVDSTCYSYGVDFVDDDSYFINTLSSDPFTCVSTFNGCNPSTAEVRTCPKSSWYYWTK